jgi:ArsR family transcriptional regulator
MVRKMTLSQKLDLSKFCKALGHPARIAILEKLAAEGGNKKDEFIDIGWIAQYTIGTNLRYLKNYKIIKGNLRLRKRFYSINFDKLKEFKILFDEFYDLLNKYHSDASNSGDTVNTKSAKRRGKVLGKRRIT